MSNPEPELPLPGGWPLNYAPDATDKLRQLEKDKVEAKYELRQVLDKYADRYGIRPLLVSDLVYTYVDDMLMDLFDDREEALRREVQRNGACQGETDHT
jgi:hypothetical protein